MRTPRLPRRLVPLFDSAFWAGPERSMMPPTSFLRFGPAKSAPKLARSTIVGFLSMERVAATGMAPVWSGRRRGHLTLLILVGFGQATAAGGAAWLFSRALAPSGESLRGPLFGVLLAAAAVIGLLGMAGRVLAERLSQDYVHEIRLGLIRRNLLDDRVTSLGGSVTRTTNDLTSLMNWMTRGVAPLAVGIPLTIGVGVVLILLDPLLAVGLLVPIAVLFPAMRMLAPIAYQRAHTVRTQRGRLSTEVAEVMQPAAAIRSTCGFDRELQRIDMHSQGLVVASIERAKVLGAMRGVVAATSGIATAVVIGTWLVAGLPTHSIAGALTMMGFLATPIHDLGRVVEHRQTYRAAKRVIRPSVARSKASAFERVQVAKVPPADVAAAVAAAYLEFSDGTKMPDLRVRTGARVVVDAGNDGRTSEVLQRFVALRKGLTGEIVVGGKNLAVAGPKEFRRLVGYAAHGMVLRRGSLSWTVRYRSPNTEQQEVDRLLAEVGLADRVVKLAQGVDTVLVRGGEPFTKSERARLLLAGAMLDDPPLLVFDHLDEDLGTAGRAIMRRLLHDYPGVVILASNDPEQIVTPTHLWRTDGVHPIAKT